MDWKQFLKPNWKKIGLVLFSLLITYLMFIGYDDEVGMIFYLIYPYPLIGIFQILTYDVAGIFSLAFIPILWYLFSSLLFYLKNNKKGNIAILIIVIYLFFNFYLWLYFSVIIDGRHPEQECRVRAITWCRNCKNAQDDLTKWDDGSNLRPDRDLVTCADKYFPGLPTNCVGADSWCGSFIPVS